MIVGTKNLIKLVAAADGIQLSNSSLTTSRHFSNTLFNIMRVDCTATAFNHISKARQIPIPLRNQQKQTSLAADMLSDNDITINNLEKIENLPEFNS